MIGQITSDILITTVKHRIVSPSSWDSQCMSLASTQQMPKTILNIQVRISSEMSVSEKLARGCVSDSEAKPGMSASGTPLRATDASEQKDLTGFDSTHRVACTSPINYSPFFRWVLLFLSKILHEVKNYKHKRDVLMWKLSWMFYEGSVRLVILPKKKPIWDFNPLFYPCVCVCICVFQMHRCTGTCMWHACRDQLLGPRTLLSLLFVEPTSLVSALLCAPGSQA